MNSCSKDQTTENGGLNISNEAVNGDVRLKVTIKDEAESKRQAELIEWLNSMLPNLNLPMGATEGDLRTCLIDGTVLCTILNKLSPGSVDECSETDSAKRFLAAMDKKWFPRFKLSDLKQGSMKPVLECLLRLKEQFNSNVERENTHITSPSANSGNQFKKGWKVLEVKHLEGIDGSRGNASPQGRYSTVSGEVTRKNLPGSKIEHALLNPVISEPSAASKHHVGHKFHEVFQLRQGSYADLPATKISEMMKSNSLDNAPTQSLLSVVNGILDENIERKNGEIPHRVACLLRSVVQEIERRISTQAEHLRTQNNVYKAREEKYQSRIKVLETLAIGTSEEAQIVMNQLQRIKSEKTKTEEKKKYDEEDVVRLLKDRDQCNLEISALKQELEVAKKTYEQRCLQLETQSTEVKFELEERLIELENLLADSKKKIKKLETFSESKYQSWSKKESSCQNFIDFHFGALNELRVASESIKKEISETQKCYSEAFNHLGSKLGGLADVAGNYHAVLAENRRLYNEVQDLKGNIRVYCRIRPFLPGQYGKQTIIEYIGENGELVVVNPSKQGKDSHRSFKFNKVFGPKATQEEVYLDIQPFIRSVLDGYNVCIFAYGQTGSGKTYTMTGPDTSSKEDWGVNYRALNDLFHISQNRRSSFNYEVGVQMVEIYNDQVRDLLSNDSLQKKLGICSTSQPSGLAVPDASMHPVKTTTDVLELMNLGLMNRAVGATALNERSSRSHSVLTIHVRGTDLETGAALRGSLHLVDLAGSERVDRSEATGDRLREAQHINKSLSSLGDVIFALAQKSPHVPYRNSKLTQILQSSLGGQAKTLMFVQLNPDMDSYLETISTLKFAERVSGVELGAARSNKEGRDVRELMEQVASLKDTIARKDEEIERLQLLKNLKNLSPNVTGEHSGRSSLRYGSSSPSRHSIGGAPQRIRRLSGGKGSSLVDKAASDQDNCSEYSDKHSESGSQQSMDDFRLHKEFFQQSRLAGGNVGQIFPADVELIGAGDAGSEERLSDISDGGLSMGTETDGSICSAVEHTLFPDSTKLAENIEKPKSPSKIPQPSQKQGKTASSQLSPLKNTSKASANLKKSSSSLSLAKPVKRWQ